MDLINFLNKDRDDILEKLLEKRILYLTGLIDYARYDLRSAEFVRDGILTLSQKSREPIKLIINSPGGEAITALTLYDVIQISPAPVYTIGLGICASAAAILLASGKAGHRYIFPHTKCCLHMMWRVVQEQRIEADDEEAEKEKEKRDRQLEVFKKMQEEIISLIIKHCNKEDTQEVRTRIRKELKSELWLNAEEAVKYGLVDQIITPTLAEILFYG